MNDLFSAMLLPATDELIEAPEDIVNESTIPNNRTNSQERTIILPGGDRSFIETAAELFSLIGKTKDLFYRGGRVHRIANNADGSQRLEPITPTQFRSIIETYGGIYAWRSGANGEKVLKPTLCPKDTADTLLESAPAAELLPNVNALSACPVLARVGDETRALGPGWHDVNGGLFVAGGVIPPVVPIEEAVKTLGAMLDDFDFASDGDRSRAIASLIAPGLRFGGWLTQALPIDIGEADGSQSGKTYRQKVVAAVYRETCNVVVQRTGGVGSLDETLSQKLIDGRPFILLDNLRGKLDTPYLESILTAPGTMPARVPHRGDVQVDTRSFVFQMTSNGVETTRDLSNRGSLIRIRRRPVDYAFRIYPEGDLNAHVAANQPYFLGCVFAVISHWVKAGQPRTDEKRHHFREWAQTLDWIVQYPFSAAPLLDGHDAARERICDPRQIWLRAICIKLRELNKTGEMVARELAEFALENDLPPPNSGRDPTEETVCRRIGTAMKAVFGVHNEVQVDGYSIRRSQRYSSTAQKDIWVYRFEGSEAA